MGSLVRASCKTPGVALECIHLRHQGITTGIHSCSVYYNQSCISQVQHELLLFSSLALDSPGSLVALPWVYPGSCLVKGDSHGLDQEDTQVYKCMCVHMCMHAYVCVCMCACAHTRQGGDRGALELPLLGSAGEKFLLCLPQNYPARLIFPFMSAWWLKVGARKSGLSSCDKTQLGTQKACTPERLFAQEFAVQSQFRWFRLSGDQEWWLCCSLAVWPWVSQWSSLDLVFFIWI